MHAFNPNFDPAAHLAQLRTPLDCTLSGVFALYANEVDEDELWLLERDFACEVSATWAWGRK